MTEEEFGAVTMSNTKKGERIATGIVARILELWPCPSFERDWNGANRFVAFKIFSPFTANEVLDCLENHRFDNPNEREPKFKEIAAKLWSVRKTRDGKKDADASSQLPSWPTIAAWADRKSDDELAHLWQIVTREYQSIADMQDRPWHFINDCDPRSGACLTIMWAVEHGVALTFKRGTDEWHAVYDEYDRQQRAKEVAEYRRRTIAASA